MGTSQSHSDSNYSSMVDALFHNPKMITLREFNSALGACGYSPPSNSVYQYFDAMTRDFPHWELAMLLAQMIHESGGFRYMEEIAYAGQRNHGAYVDSVSLPGRDYHGRGYIQLTWAANYRAASRALGMGDDLLRNPDKVASDPELAMRVSVWYWTDRVRPVLAADRNQFGLTTKAINGAIECSGGYNETAHRRYRLYLKVADAMGVRTIASECGCYN